MVTLINEMPVIDCLNAAYAKVACAAKAYMGYDKIALFWQQTDSDNNITALISLVDGVMSLANLGGDLFELKEFIKCISPYGVFTDISTAKALNLKIETECDTLFIKPPYNFENAAENTYAGVSYACETVAERLDVGNINVFKADISHRIRHDACGYVTTPASAAFLLYSNNIAIISGIAVKKTNQKTGIGSATLKRLLEIAKHRPVLVCAEQKNTPFYLKNGFTLNGKFAYCRLGVKF